MGLRVTDYSDYGIKFCLKKDINVKNLKTLGYKADGKLIQARLKKLDYIWIETGGNGYIKHVKGYLIDDFKYHFPRLDEDYPY